MVLPLTCVVYCEAPITVARMPSFERSSLRAPARDPRLDLLRQQHAEIAERRGFAAVDVFGDAAGKRDLVDRRGSGQRREPQQAGAARGRRLPAHRLEQPLRHAGGQRARRLRRKLLADLEADAVRGGEAAAGLLDARDAAVGIEADQARADVERGDVDHAAFGADRDLRGAAADVHVHDRGLVADRARHRAGAVRGHHRLQAVAGRDRDHLAGLAREQLADLAGVAPAHRHAGEDQRAGVDLVRIDIGVLVLALDEGAERLRVDLLLGRIGREQDVGLEEGLASGDDVAAVEPLQHDAREHQMRGRRADVDADAENDDLVLVDQRAPGRGEEDAAALGFVIAHRANPRLSSPRKRGPSNHRCRNEARSRNIARLKFTGSSALLHG